MPSFEHLIGLFVATAIFAYMPGPAMLYAAAQTIAGGKKAGWLAALGIHVGGYAHVIAAALGLALLFQAVPILYTSMKLLGAAYLVFLGAKLFMTKSSSRMAPLKFNPKSSKRAFWESVTVEVLNPKTAIFYVAFLPQFVDVQASMPVWVQLVVLGTVVNFMFSSADALCVMLSHKLLNAAKSSSYLSRVAQKIGGGILITLGCRLALASD